MFTIDNESKKSEARLARLKTPHGIAKTPLFMPVNTRAAMKHITVEDLNKMGAQAIIANAFVLYLRPGEQFIKEMGGIHKLMNYNHVIFTDSGGFQMLDKDFLLAVTDKGAKFRNPADGKVHFLTPEDVMRYEQNIGGDVAMTLDHVPHFGKTKKDYVDSMKLTHAWAKRCKIAHEKLKEENKTKQLLFGINQGGTFADLREKSAKEIDKLDFDGIALGGLCIGEPKEVMHKMIKSSLKNTNPDKPRYLMGVGSPAELVESVHQGIDIFDSVFPTRNARHRMLFTKNGPIKINHAVHKFDKNPIDKECDCFVCKTHSRAYIRYLFNIDDPLAFRLSSYHNTYFVQKLMNEIRQNIKENTFEKFRKDFLKQYSTESKKLMHI